MDPSLVLGVLIIILLLVLVVQNAYTPTPERFVERAQTTTCSRPTNL